MYNFSYFSVNIYPWALAFHGRSLIEKGGRGMQGEGRAVLGGGKGWEGGKGVGRWEIPGKREGKALEEERERLGRKEEKVRKERWKSWEGGRERC